MVMNPKDFYVYVHRRATDSKVFYVGKGHANRAWSEKGRNKYWHKIVGKHGFVVELAVSGAQEWYALEREIELIAQLRESDHVLANVTDGGDGVSGLKFTEFSRKRMSDAQKDRYVKNPALRTKVASRMANLTPSEKAVMQRRASEAVKSPETRKKYSEASSAMWRTDGFKEKHAKAMADVRANPSHIEKHREATRAAKLRPDERKRQSEMMKRLMADPSRREQISIATRAAYQSEEVRQRHKEATAKAFERPEVIANYRAAMASPEVRAKISEAQAHKRIPVVCVESGALFKSALDAAAWLKEGGFPSAQHNAVRGACAGKRKTAYGLHWTYAEKQRS